MSTVISSDGTAIAYERTGDGPPVILVDGALCYRDSGPSGPLATRLAERFSVITYDRRGRGESAKAASSSVELEIDDLEALIAAAGGSAHLYGISSGAVLALDAAARGIGVRSLAVYEPPFIVDGSRPPIGPEYVAALEAALGDGRRADAVRLFMRQVGVPRAIVALMRFLPAWPKLKGVAHTLPYDAAIMGATQSGAPLPRERWAAVTVPTLVLAGGRSPEWMRAGARSLAELLPDARQGVLEGQTHIVSAKALAPVLGEFFEQRVAAAA